MVTPNDSSVEEDVGALIYRESQLRKADAAARAAESKMTSTASTHHRTSRKRSNVTSQSKESLSIPQRKGSTKRKRDSSLENDLPRKKDGKKEAQKGMLC